MKLADMRVLDAAGLAAKVKELREELFKLRFQHATAQLEKTHRLPEVKKDIARLLTLMSEKNSQAARG